MLDLRRSAPVLLVGLNYPVSFPLIVFGNVSERSCQSMEARTFNFLRFLPILIRQLSFWLSCWINPMDSPGILSAQEIAVSNLLRVLAIQRACNCPVKPKPIGVSRAVDENLPNLRLGSPQMSRLFAYVLDLQ